jgi:FdhD protein
VPSSRDIRRVDLLAVTGGVGAERSDPIAVEEPLEIRAEGPGQPASAIAVTMRTPGHEAELAVGFLFTEGLIRTHEDVQRPATRELVVEGSANNVVTVRLTAQFDAERLKRNFYATSSCGICGKASLEHLHANAPSLEVASTTIARSLLVRLPAVLREAQVVFEQTGGLHATGIFDRGGKLLVLREDVGRHNAMDKAIGRMLLDRRVPLADCILVVSGRVSFELVQKAAMAGAPLLCAISAPSSLAVQAAERLGMTVVGFLRGDTFNVYTHPERIDLGA